MGLNLITGYNIECDESGSKYDRSRTAIGEEINVNHNALKAIRLQKDIKNTNKMYY